VFRFAAAALAALDSAVPLAHRSAFSQRSQAAETGRQGRPRRSFTSQI